MTTYVWKALLPSCTLYLFLSPKIFTVIELQIKDGKAEMYLKIQEIQTELGTNSEDALLRELETDVE